MSSKADNITFGPVDKSSVGLLKIIHRELLPIHYSESIYNILKEGIQAKGIIAYYNGDTAVGEICFRTEEEVDGKDTITKIHLMTISVLPSYQRMGIATKLFEKFMENVTDESMVYLHVLPENEKAISLYKKLGFNLVMKEVGYYKSLNHADALLFTKQLKK